MKRARPVVASLAGALLALGIATGQAFAAPSGPPIRIGSTLSLTGPLSGTAIIHKLVGEIYVEQLNKKNGLLGRPVEWIVKDDQSKPDLARTLYEQLITAELAAQLASLERDHYVVERAPVDQVEAHLVLARHLADALAHALASVRGDDRERLDAQVDLSNRVLAALRGTSARDELAVRATVAPGPAGSLAISRGHSAPTTDTMMPCRPVTPSRR